MLLGAAPARAGPRGGARGGGQGGQGGRLRFRGRRRGVARQAGAGRDGGGGRMAVGQAVELVDVPPFVKTFEAHPCMLSPSAAGLEPGAVGTVVKVLPVGDVAVRFTSRSLIVAERLLRCLGGHPTSGSTGA